MPEHDYDAAIRELHHASSTLDAGFNVEWSPRMAEGIRAALAIVREAQRRRDVVGERLDYWLAQYPEDVFPDPDKGVEPHAGFVMRLMLPRIKTDLLTILRAGESDA